jgi:O-antigen/teichoic acid export membrane protein
MTSQGAEVDQARAESKNWLIALAALFTNQGISVLVGALAAASLAPALFGVVNLARTLVMLLCVLCSLGLELGLQKHLARRENSRGAAMGVVRQLRALTFALSVTVLAICVFGGADYLETAFFKHAEFSTALIVTAVALPFATDLAVLGGAYRGLYRPAPSILAQLIIQPSVRGLTVIVCLWMGQAFLALPLGIALGYFSGWAVLATLAIRPMATQVKWRETSAAAIQAVLAYSVPLGLTVFIVMLTRMLDLLLMGIFRSPTELGHYSVVLLMTQLIVLAGIASGQTLGARVATAHGDGNRLRIKEIQTSNMTRVATIAAPLFAGVVIWGDHIDLLIGDSYGLDWRVIVLAATSAALISVTDNLGHTLGMTGHHHREFSIIVVGFVVQSVACLALIPDFGQVGAAAASLITAIVIWLARLWTINRLFGILIGTGKAVYPFAMALSLGLLISIAGSSLVERTLTATAVSCVLFLGFYAFALFATAARFGTLERSFWKWGI